MGRKQVNNDYQQWEEPEQYVAAAGNVILLTAVSATGPGAGVDTTKVSGHISMHVVIGGATPDPTVVVQLEGSLDNTNFFSMGRKTGPGRYVTQQAAVQYLRANVISIASGTVTVNAGAV
jgi:hypothetical protein